MKTKQKTNGLLLTACIISYSSVIMAIVVAVMLAFNIAGASDDYMELIKTFMQDTTDLSGQVTMTIIELGFTALLNLYFAGYYMKGLKFRIDSQPYGKMLVTQGLFQMIIASFLSGIFVVIAGARMSKKRPTVESQQSESYISEYKMQAMSEAIKRLKELKAQGAISEEEYFATLNKILEG